MNANKKLYKDYTKKHAPKSSMLKNVILAFVVGGLICVLGQALKQLYAGWIQEEKTVGALVSVTLIFLSCLLTSLGIYDKLAKHAGAGTLVPITGFANATISPALDNKSEGMVTGLAAKLFIISGPVIVYGTLASVIYGIVYWVCKLF